MQSKHGSYDDWMSSVTLSASRNYCQRHCSQTTMYSGDYSSDQVLIKGISKHSGPEAGQRDVMGVDERVNKSLEEKLLLMFVVFVDSL